MLALRTHSVVLQPFINLVSVEEMRAGKRGHVITLLDFAHANAAISLGRAGVLGGGQSRKLLHGGSFGLDLAHSLLELQQLVVGHPVHVDLAAAAAAARSRARTSSTSATKHMKVKGAGKETREATTSTSSSSST